jgi:hypothetical protein
MAAKSLKRSTRPNILSRIPIGLIKGLVTAAAQKERGRGTEEVQKRYGGREGGNYSITGLLSVDTFIVIT